MSETPAQFEVFRASRSLVTGGAGFIGSHIAERLLALGSDVVVLDDLSSGHRSNVPDGAEFVEGSILDADALARATKGCRYVFHEAAMVSVPQSVEQPEECARVNILGTERVLSAAASAGADRLVFAASAAAYGNSPSLPSRESEAPDAWSPYAASKVASEQLLQAFARCTDLSTASLRYFNVFGPRQDPKSPYAAVISAFADRLLTGRSVTIHGDGKQTRDFVYIANVVHANLLAASSPRDLRGEVINIGTGRRCTLLEVLNAMRACVETSEAPGFGPARPGDVRDSCADISSARKLLGYEPLVTLEDGLRTTMEHERGRSR